jgi:hypothetical protein
MSNTYIQARSPYIININEAGQTGSKVEIFIWNTGSTPATPQYTLSKLIPASNNLQTTYNVAPYIREYISHLAFNNNYSTNNSLTPTNEYCKVLIKKYKKVGLSTYVFVSGTSLYASDGYGYYSELMNPVNGRFFLEQGTYYYHYDGVDPSTTGSRRGGIITMDLESGDYVKYTEIGTGNVSINNITTNGVYDMYRVYPAAYANGNKVEVFDNGDILLRTYTFLPYDECRYEPVVIDFINKFGGWQREFFFKASNTSIGIEGTEYNLLQSNLVNYSALEGQKSVFNVNGREVIKTNTGFVTEAFNSSLQQLMLSERILVNNRPAKLNTKSTELQKNINNKMINYQMEFEFANDIINSVV